MIGRCDMPSDDECLHHDSGEFVDYARTLLAMGFCLVPTATASGNLDVVALTRSDVMVATTTREGCAAAAVTVDEVEEMRRVLLALTKGCAGRLRAAGVGATASWTARYRAH